MIDRPRRAPIERVVGAFPTTTARRDADRASVDAPAPIAAACVAADATMRAANYSKSVGFLVCATGAACARHFSESNDRAARRTRA